MGRLLVLGLVALGIAAGIRATSKSLPKLMEAMMERVMPKMMDSCFAQMDAERRDFILAHCRGMLDKMEQKYVTAKEATSSTITPQEA